MTTVAIDPLPSAVSDGLDTFATDLKQTLGDSLLSLVLFGDAAKGEEFRPGHSDVKVMLVLRKVSTAELDRITPYIAAGIRRFRLSPMIVSLDDLRRSTDVFPVKFFDMQQHHRLLAGEDVLAELEIRDDHLRLRCEQELKNLNLRLHALYVRSGGRKELLRESLVQAIEPFLLDLRMLMMLKFGTAPARRDEIVTTAGDTLGVDASRLGTLLRLRSDRTKLSLDELKTLFDGLMHDVQQAALIADEL